MKSVDVNSLSHFGNEKKKMRHLLERKATANKITFMIGKTSTCF